MFNHGHSEKFHDVSDTSQSCLAISTNSRTIRSLARIESWLSRTTGSLLRSPTCVLSVGLTAFKREAASFEFSRPRQKYTRFSAGKALEPPTSNMNPFGIQRQLKSADVINPHVTPVLK